jgi:outer membrane protein assembly factor BamB
MLYNLKIMRVSIGLKAFGLFRNFSCFFLIFVYFFVALQLSASAQSSLIQLDRPVKPCWQSSEKIVSSLQISGTTAFFSLLDGTIEAFDVATAKMIWRSQYGGNLISASVLINGQLAVVHETFKNETENEKNSRKNVVLRLLSSITGLTLWQKSFDFNSDSSRFFVLSDTPRIFLLSDKAIIALNKNEGSILWTKSFSSGLSSFLLADGLILVSSINNLLVLSAQTGEIIQKIQHKMPIVGKMNFLKGVIYFGDEAGKIFAYDLNKRKLLWKAITGASIVSIKALEKIVLVSSNDNFVYLLSAQNGDKIWKKRFSNKPINDLVIYEGFAIVETLDENKISVLSLKTGEIVNQIELDSTPVASPAIVSGILLVPTAKGLKAFANSCN